MASRPFKHAAVKGTVAGISVERPRRLHWETLEPPSSPLKGRSTLHTLPIRRSLALAIGTAGLLAGALAGPAFAADTVTQTITAGGGLSASVANLSFPSVGYQNAAHDVTGTMILTADDSRDTSAGWSTTCTWSVTVAEWIARA